MPELSGVPRVSGICSTGPEADEPFGAPGAGEGARRAETRRPAGVLELVPRVGVVVLVEAGADVEGVDRELGVVGHWGSFLVGVEAVPSTPALCSLKITSCAVLACRDSFSVGLGRKRPVSDRIHPRSGGAGARLRARVCQADAQIGGRFPVRGPHRRARADVRRCRS